MTRDSADFVQPAEAFDAAHEANPWYYEMETPGLNYRLPDILCALGTNQLKKLNRFAARRRELVAAYDRELASFGPRVKPLSRTPDVTPAWHLYVVLIDFAALGADRAAVMRRLADQGIGTQVHYLPVYRQPYYREFNPELKLPGADAYYRRALSLPLFPSMADGDPARVVRALGLALGL
jgi:dTDP-4-amino-4,6-dideoxygalactose transaminase